jgi:hypothetical protein
MKRQVSIEDAVGLKLAHDITEIRPGEFKGPAFRRGHVVRAEDLEHLRRLGKANLFVLDLREDELHEDEAVGLLAGALCGENVAPSGEPREGKLELVAQDDGLLKVDTVRLLEFNMLGSVMCATRHGDVVVKKGQPVAGTRAIPLAIERETVARAVEIASAGGGLIAVKKLASRRVGVIITGSEVFEGLIEDRFEPLIRGKVTELGSRVMEVVLAPDDEGWIREVIEKFLAQKIELIILTGGMSVDPDDVTRLAVKQAGASRILYGSPVLPGAMLLVAQIGEVMLVGVPACAIYYQTTVFDLVLPRLLAGEQLTRKDIAALGPGGLCLDCKICDYPDCSFGKH